MPALPSAPNCLRIRFLHTVGNDTNTGWHLFFRGDKAANGAQMSAVVVAAQTAWGTNFAPLTSADTTLTRTNGTDLSDPAGTFAEDPTTHVGTRVGGFLPASTCMLYNMVIGRRYRGGKPRVYLPVGVQPDLSNAQTWNAALANSVNTAMSAVVTAIENSIKTWSSTADLVNISYYHLVNVAPPGSTPIYKTVLRDSPQVDPIVGRQANLTVSSQRRRLRPG